MLQVSPCTGYGVPNTRSTVLFSMLPFWKDYSYASGGYVGSSGKNGSAICHNCTRSMRNCLRVAGPFFSLDSIFYHFVMDDCAFCYPPPPFFCVEELFELTQLSGVPLSKDVFKVVSLQALLTVFGGVRV